MSGLFQRDPRAGAFLGGDRVSGQDIRDQNGTFLLRFLVKSLTSLSHRGAIHCKHRQKLTGPARSRQDARGQHWRITMSPDCALHQADLHRQCRKLRYLMTALPFYHCWPLNTPLEGSSSILPRNKTKRSGTEPLLLSSLPPNSFAVPTNSSRPKYTPRRS
jgi:hypothetical protein